PTSQSTAYTAPFSLTESTTVKAIAYDATGAASAVATKEFEKTLVITTAAEYNALPENTTFVFNGNLVVSGQKNKYLYAQDATGGALIYGTAPTYSKGDVIPAGFTAKKVNYNGTIEMSEMTGMQAATETAELVAQELAINQFADNQNIYAVVKGATISGNTLTIGDETLAIYNRFGITFPTDDKTYDVYGVATIYNNAPQLLPLEFVEVVEKTETPTIACLEGETEYTFIVNGLGELKLYANGVEVEIPYIVTRTSEDQVITLVATAQEEGKVISDPREWTVTVPKLEVVEIEELYVVGDFNGWSTTEGVVELVENESNEFVGTVEFEANGEFKLITPNPDVTATTGWIWFGGQDDNGVDYFEINEGMLDHEISLVNGANFRVVDAGEYTITVKEAAVVPGGKGVQEPLVMIVTKNAPQAIETIGRENVSAVRYYNLQGVESATPFEGVNIVVRMMNDGTKSVSKMVK
ncbi:MAG: chitobiase/beta-hexosaminidase C-terminal domain-containing protein, partial [Muribaculaceae bacterium]|nr:chitobiase/beta-hexosaminidase C-terminal domain-containing protein [Muribaculaceae bacterium]